MADTEEHFLALLVCVFDILVMNQRTKEQTNEWMNERASEWTNDGMNEPTNERMNAWMNEFDTLVMKRDGSKIQLSIALQSKPQLFPEGWSKNVKSQECPNGPFLHLWIGKYPR